MPIGYDAFALTWLYAVLAGWLETDVGFQPFYFVWWEIL